jgi:hypothetical protein
VYVYNVYVCMHVCMYVCLYVCMYVCMYVCGHDQKFMTNNGDFWRERPSYIYLVPQYIIDTQVKQIENHG